MTVIPQSTNNEFKWTQPNNTDNSGDLWASFNLDTEENVGRLRLGKRMILNTGTDDVAQINSFPAAILKTGSKNRFIAGNGTGYVFEGDDTPFGTFTRDVSSNSPAKINSTLDDAVYANNALYVISEESSGSNLAFYKKIGELTWAETDIGVSAGYPSSAVRSNVSGDTRVYVATQYSRIISWDSSDSIDLTGDYTLNLSPGVVDGGRLITKILAASDRLWVLTLNNQGERGRIYEWDGISPNFQNEYVLESSGALSGVIHNDIPYIMDTNGNLCSWNGGSFKVLTGFNRENNKFLYNPLGLTNNRFIHPNGMAVIDSQIHILINNLNYDSGATIEEPIPSGIYAYDENTNSLVHRYAVSQGKSTDIYKDFGAVRIAAAGALTEVTQPSTSSSDNGTLLAGFGYYSDATTAKYGIFYEDNADTRQKAGYLITKKIDSVGSKSENSVKNMWQKIFTLYRKFLTENDKIVVKYRTSDQSPTEATITWTSTNTFTTTTDISLYWTSGTGGEVEILNGIGAGKCSHITNISYNAGTYTVTVDETYYGATGTAKARFQFWNKLNSITNRLETYTESIVNVKSNWIQFKIWMTWIGKNEIERLLIVNENNTPAK